MAPGSTKFLSWLTKTNSDLRFRLLLETGCKNYTVFLECLVTSKYSEQVGEVKYDDGIITVILFHSFPRAKGNSTRNLQKGLVNRGLFSLFYSGYFVFLSRLFSTKFKKKVSVLGIKSGPFPLVSHCFCRSCLSERQGHEIHKSPG